MHPRLHSLSIISALALFATLCSSVLAQNDSQAQQFQRTFTANPGATVAVENYKGTIHVTGADSNQVVVDVRKRFDGNDVDRKWWMENVKVSFRNAPGMIEVKVDYPSQTWNCMFCWRDHSFSDEVDLEIRAPRKINLKLDGYKPDIKISSLEGDVAIKSYKAPMLIESTTGAIRIDTYKDTITLRNVTLRGPLDVKSYKADLEVSANALGPTADLETEKGAIVLRVPEDAGLDVDYSGGRRSSFHSDFNLSASMDDGESVRGTINRGGTRLRLRTEKGSISLKKLPRGL
jgi:Putative adhesin